MKYTIADLQTIQECPELQQKGVFIVRCQTTGDAYLGGTQRSFRLSWKEFRKQMRSSYNKRISRRIRDLWQAHGDRAFEFEILEVTDSESLAQAKAHYIELYQPSLNHS